MTVQFYGDNREDELTEDLGTVSLQSRASQRLEMKRIINSLQEVSNVNVVTHTSCCLIFLMSLFIVHFFLYFKWGGGSRLVPRVKMTLS